MQDIILFLGLLGGAFVLYILLITLLPRYLPATAVARPLQWAHRASGAVILLAILVSWGPWELRIRYPAFFSLLIVGCGLLGGIWAKLAVGPARTWAQAQAWLTPFLVPFLIVWLTLRDNENEVVYQDEQFRIELETWTGMISETTNTRITLYQTRVLLFEQRIGNLHVGFLGPDANRNVDLSTQQGWATIHRVIVDTDSLKGIAQTQAGEYPFVITKPDGDESPPPAPATAPVEAPPPPVDDNQVYNYVEEMPHLPGRPGNRPIEQAILSRLVLPRDVQEGRVFLRLEVDTAGDVRNLYIEKGLNASTDSAVLVAARQLPRLIPGRQHGRPVIVQLILGDLLVTKPTAGRDQKTKRLAYVRPTATIYDMVDHLPQLPGGDGTQALEEALVRTFHYPTGVQPSQVNGTLYVEVVVTQTGKVTTIELNRSSGSKRVPATIDNAIRASLHQLPPLVPARLDGQPVATKLHLTWSFSRSFSDANTHLQVAIEQRIKEFDLGGSSDLEGL